jgi:hypothetical protein
MKKIETFRFQSLKNVEFTLAVPHIVGIVGRYPCVRWQLEKRLETLEAFLPDLDRIEAQERRWREAEALDEDERLRDAYVKTLIT